jgi:ubiquinone/menaquinone biosynthesis C-methylase UbiE/acyl carrier protein
LKAESSYKIQNFAANVDSEIRRLKAQVELFWDKELKCLRMFGLRDGMGILECGCGPGHVIEKLLQSFPGSDVTGVDIDRFLVQKSKETLASLGGNRGHIFEQSIMQMDFVDNSFDFVIARLVLEHLPDPLSAVKEVYRVLKTGGKGVFIDNDFDMHLRAYPDIPELNELYEAYCRCRIDEGGKPRIGRELPVILHEGGFSNIDLEIVSAHSRVLGDGAFLKSEGSGIPAQLVKDGYLSRDVLDRLARKWHDVLQQKQHVFFRQLFVAVGEKLPSYAGQPKPELQQIGRGRRTPAVHGILSAGSHEESCRLLTAYLQVQVAAFLETGQESIQVDQPLIALGVNSLMSVELVNNVETDFAITISPVDILEAQSILAIATRLNTEIEKRKQPGSASVPTYETRGTEIGGGSYTYENAVSVQNDNEWEDGYI